MTPSFLFLLLFGAGQLVLASSPTVPNVPSPAFEVLAQAQSQKLYLHPTWLKLGHYQKNFFSGYTSLADGAGFFISKDGKADPENELTADFAAFMKSSEEWKAEEDSRIAHLTDKNEWNIKVRQHPQCQFPARVLFLNEQLKLGESFFPKVDCTDYREYLARVSAESFSLVFSSYYLSNPSSAFGHTFLKINKKGRKNELLDFGVSYAAVVTTQNPLLYALGGILGGFQGTFTNVPYYYKIREYNDFESRDLFTYDLNLTPKEVSFLLAHLWELGSTHFNYYFFTKNCSYHILAALEVARADLALTAKLPYWVVPADTLKVALKEKDLVSRTTYRPSIRTTTLARYSSLDVTERLLFSKLKSSFIRNQALLGERSAISQMNILDTLIDFHEMKNPEDQAFQKEDVKKVKQALLIARSQLKMASPELTITPEKKDYPESGHDSSRLGLEVGRESFQMGMYEQASFRFALHDLSDYSFGYPAHSQMEFFHLKARYYSDIARLEFEELTLAKAQSLNPLSQFSSNLSWKLDVSLKRFRDLSCTRCFGGSFLVGGGYTVAPLSHASFFVLGEVEPAFSPEFSGSPLRLGLGPTLGTLIEPFSWLKILAQTRYSVFLFSNRIDAFSWEVAPRAALTKQISFQAQYRKWPISEEVSGSLFVYF